MSRKHCGRAGVVGGSLVRVLGAALVIGMVSGVSARARLAAQSAAPALPKPAPASGSGQDLSAQATDPTASLMAINLISDVKASYWDTDGGGYEFRFQPVIPFKVWGASNIMRVVVPYQASGPGDEGLKSVTLFDIVVVPRKWGRLAFGPVMNFSESAGDAPSKFAIGPAVGVVVPRSRRLNIGMFTQNLFASGVGITQLQPIVAYQLGHGWALSAGDLQFTYDWEREEWVDVPVGFQLGVVKPIAGQPLRFAVNPQWNLKNISGSDKAKVVFTVTLLVPGA